MEHREHTSAAKLLLRWRRRKAWQKAVMCLAAIVVFCTAYALILPAITLEQDTICGQEAHTHSDACYSTKSTLICEFPEQPAHTHTEACYAEEQILTCTGEHGHTEACYETERRLACGMEETEGHAHTGECYETERVLRCGKEEHIHTEMCYPAEETAPSSAEERGEPDTAEIPPESDPNADLETREDWEAALEAVELTGDWAEDVLAIAESQLGYAESTRNFLVDDTGSVRGYTRYGAWYGDPYGGWCAMFASFCLHYAEVRDFPLDADCGAWIETLSKEPYALYHEAGTYTPEPGDLVFFDWNNNHSADHVGIVAEVVPATEKEPEKLKTIEGNSDNQVRYETYFLSDGSVLGYGELPEKPLEVAADAAAPEESAVAEAPMVSEIPQIPVETQSFAHEDDTVSVTVSLPDAAVPEDAALVVRSITDEDETYEDLARRAADALDGEAAEIVLYDIGFFTPDDERISVSDTATVSIQFKERVMPQSGSVSVLHYESEADAPVALERVAVEMDEDATVSGLTFQTEGLSVFAVAHVVSPAYQEISVNTHTIADDTNRAVPTNACTDEFVLCLRKTDSITGQPLKGAEFKLYGSYEEAADTRDAVQYEAADGKIETLYYIGMTEPSDENGLAKVSGLNLSGEDKTYAYALSEIVAPDGYAKPGYDVVPPDQVISVTAADVENNSYSTEIGNQTIGAPLIVRQEVSEESLNEEKLYSVEITISAPDETLRNQNRAYFYDIYHADGTAASTNLSAIGDQPTKTADPDLEKPNVDTCAFTVQLQAGQYVVVRDVPIGYSYQVQETKAADGADYCGIVNKNGTGCYDNAGSTICGTVMEVPAEITDTTDAGYADQAAARALNTVTVSNYAAASVRDAVTEITVVKKWNGAPGNEAVFDLYRVTDGDLQAAELAWTVTLTAEANDADCDGIWTYTWENLPLYDANERACDYYLAEESMGGYIPSCDSETAQITVDGKKLHAVHATSATIEVTNTAGAELPASGGTGTSLYMLGGLLLTAGAGYLLYHEMKRRKRDSRAT